MMFVDIKLQWADEWVFTVYTVSCTQYAALSAASWKGNIRRRLPNVAQPKSAIR